MLVTRRRCSSWTGVRVLTDPLLRPRVMHLERRGPPVRVEKLSRVDLVLVSHLHHDHFDPPSLRMLDRGAALVVPRGAQRMAGKLGFANVIELARGGDDHRAGLEVSATHAKHGRGRMPGGRSRAVGFTVTGAQRIYFAGDTDLFGGMRELGDLDLALLPVWGWGPKLGPGHLNPSRAARGGDAAKPRVAVPIHWGTLFPTGLRSYRSHLMTEPPRAFRAHVGAARARGGRARARAGRGDDRLAPVRAIAFFGPQEKTLARLLPAD